jgi:aminomethyltransferase
MTGYQALRERAAFVDLSSRGKIKMTGEDRARLLHAMSTNHIQQLQPGSGCYAFFLNDKGRILADASILCRADSLLLDTEPETRETLYQHLDRFIIADDVALEDETPAVATVAIEGPAARRVLEALDAPVPESEYANIEWGARLVAKISASGGQGYRVFAPRDEKSALLNALESAGAEPADLEALRVVRLEHGKPRYGEDISDRFLAQEANQPQALNFNKGCYLGQEIVERVRSRGQIHRVLMPLTIDTNDPPAPGTKLQIGDTAAAEITSAAYSPGLGKVVALGYVRTEHAKPHTAMTLGEIHAEVAAPAETR